MTLDTLQYTGSPTAHSPEAEGPCSGLSADVAFLSDFPSCSCSDSRGVLMGHQGFSMFAI